VISRETDADLLNWGRWCNAGPWPHPLPQGRAASAEGRHIPDLGDIWDDAPPSQPPINVDRAKIVQSVYDTRLTQPERKVLQSEYCHRDRYVRTRKSGAREFDRATAARRLGLPLRIYSDMLTRAARMVGEAVDLRV
jgi:hypothetical protein